MRASTTFVWGIALTACAGAAEAADGPRAPAAPGANWSVPPHFDGSRFDPAPVRRGSFIASIPVAPNATVGLGRFNAMPKRRLGAPDPSLAPGRVRRAAVGLSLRF
jgi:hypothetical protein